LAARTFFEEDAEMAWESQVTNPFESIPDPDEEFRQIEEIAALTIRLLERRYPAPNSILRAVHPKSHGCLHAQFEVLKDLAKEHQVGLFSHPGAAYDAVVRFSNADTFVRADLRGGENGSRGMAIKIFDVPGAVLYDDAGRLRKQVYFASADRRCGTRRYPRDRPATE
jgi:hypothetical protein